MKAKIRTGAKNKWAYRLKNGDFYREGNRGSFSLKARPYSRKELTVKTVVDATLFSLNLGYVPYDVGFMAGGKWVKVTITSTYETVPV